MDGSPLPSPLPSKTAALERAGSPTSPHLVWFWTPGASLSALASRPCPDWGTAQARMKVSERHDSWPVSQPRLRLASMDSERSKGEVISAISDGLVQLHTRYYGKGPTRIKTTVSDDVVVSLLWGGFTQIEETLIASGRGETVSQLRRTFQDAMETEFTRVIEEATGQKVLAYLSQVHLEPNLSVELFVLDPKRGP